MVTLTNLERPAASYGPMSLLQKLLKSMADLETPSKTGFQTIPMLSSYHFGNSLIGDQMIKYQVFFQLWIWAAAMRPFWVHLGRSTCIPCFAGFSFFCLKLSLILYLKRFPWDQNLVSIISLLDRLSTLNKCTGFPGIKILYTCLIYQHQILADTI